jgi:GH24 family phage-related lysozyme (muramidase)
MMNAWDIFANGQERWELMMLTAYRDKGDPPPWAIGLGHTNANGLPPFVDENTRLKDRDEGLAIFKNDIDVIYVPQLKALFNKINFVPPNDYYFYGFLGTLYNRGAGRLAGADAGSKLKGSYAWHLLKTTKGQKNWMVRAANALAHSHVEDFTTLDTAWDDEIKAERVYEGLVSRRSFDNALCMWEKF